MISIGIISIGMSFLKSLLNVRMYTLKMHILGITPHEICC